jgi:hypothetical protein
VEIEGHPTQDLLEELERRGALRLDGSTSGPHEASLRFIAERVGDVAGLWLFLPYQAFDTGFDEPPD